MVIVAKPESGALGEGLHRIESGGVALRALIDVDSLAGRCLEEDPVAIARLPAADPEDRPALQVRAQACISESGAFSTVAGQLGKAFAAVDRRQLGYGASHRIDPPAELYAAGWWHRINNDAAAVPAFDVDRPGIRPEQVVGPGGEVEPMQLRLLEVAVGAAGG